MSKSPLPTSNPCKQVPQKYGKHGGINWGDQAGGGCWCKRVIRNQHRSGLDRKESTLTY